ncbi:MAG: transposase family protein, partial [bacterium]|nr:transposase family protein [bacterium]
MSADVMSVRLHLRGVRVTEVVVDTLTELIVGVVSTKKLSGCPGCGRSCRRVHDRRRKQIRDLEVSGRRTVLLWTQRRFVCDECGKRHMETHSQFLGGMTRRLARRLVQDAQLMSIQVVSRRHRVSWHLIMGLVTEWSGLIQTRRRRQRCRGACQIVCVRGWVHYGFIGLGS